MPRPPKEFDFDLLKNMTKRQRVSTLQVLSKRANERMRALSKAGINSSALAKANYWLKKENKQFFNPSMKLSDFKLETLENVLKEFLTSPSSTITGYRAQQSKRIETFKQKGLKIKDPQKFMDFLASQQFKALSRYVDSDQLVEDFDQAIDEGYTAQQIQQQYDQFMQGDMTFEQIAEQRASGALLK